jgi:hypothetical protein
MIPACIAFAKLRQSKAGEAGIFYDIIIDNMKNMLAFRIGCALLGSIVLFFQSYSFNNSFVWDHISILGVVLLVYSFYLIIIAILNKLSIIDTEMSSFKIEGSILGAIAAFIFSLEVHKNKFVLDVLSIVGIMLLLNSIYLIATTVRSKQK